MKKIKVIAIDDNKELLEEIELYFKEKDIEIITAQDGKQGIELINKNKDIDLILLDLVMPNIDGIELLKYLNKNNISIKTIIISATKSQQIIQKVTELGAIYYLLKPIKLEYLEEIINELLNKQKNRKIDLYTNNLLLSITNILHELGVPSHIKGYQYVREAISIVYDKPELIREVTKKIYPQIANKYNTTTSRVERSIRHAIEISWNRANYDYMEEIFGYSIDINKDKPTNSEYILTIADKIRLDYNKPFIST